MMHCEVKWETSQLYSPDTFAVEYGQFCKRHTAALSGKLIADVRATRKALLWFFSVSSSFTHPAYMLARHWGTYTAAEVYPLWLHKNDIPTLQAARGQNPELRSYLKERAREWSSNYIAADLRIDVWAARACLDLYGIRTPLDAYAPRTRPRAEIGYVHDASRVAAFLDSGLTAKETANELGVTEKFLRDTWRALRIDPELGRHNTVSMHHEDWLDRLRGGIAIGGKPGCKVHSIGEAARCWGVIYNTAKKRLQLLGWEPYTSVQTLLKPAPEVDQ